MYYVIMCIASFVTTMFGLLITLVPAYVSDDVLRIPVGIALMLVGFASALKYMMLGFENENYYRENMKL